jgi:glycosyltransferase involved in cell wall biosynthesis
MPFPLILFTYKRPIHTKATLDALAANTLAPHTDLYVFSDGPKGENDAALVEEVRKLIRGARGFASVTIAERATNMGLAQSIIVGVTELLTKFDAVIVLEDDLVTSPQFLAFMNRALLQYQNDSKAFSITGFTYPSNCFSLPYGYPFDTYVTNRCCSNSWATWRDRWLRVDWEMNDYDFFCKDTSAQELFDQGGQDLVQMLRMQHHREIDSWAIRFCYAHHTNAMHCIYPAQSLVMNIGLDNSGTHSAPDTRYQHNSLDLLWEPKHLAPASPIDSEIARRFRSIFDHPSRSQVTFSKRAIAYSYALSGRLLGMVLRGARRLRNRPPRSVDVLFVNTYQRYGGAARAAYRAFQGIKARYPNTAFLTLFKNDTDPLVFGLEPTSVRGALAQRLLKIEQTDLQRYPSRKAAPFSPSNQVNPLRMSLAQFKPKLVHLHWVNHGLLRVEELSALQCPVVWTLHDAWAFTGGCHHPNDCKGYLSGCGNCPQLCSRDSQDISHASMLRKQAAYVQMDLTVVAPSHWLAQLAASSPLFDRKSIEVIPNGLDLQTFKPVDKGMAKNYFGLEPDYPVILFGAHSLHDPNKGLDLLLKTISALNIRCTLLTFGDGIVHRDSNVIWTVHSLGTLSDEVSLALAYSAADVFICPSRLDNLPNTVAEALACGTPCAAFRVGGIPEMIDHQRTGWLAQPYDIDDLASGIKWLIAHPNPNQLRLASRAKAEADYNQSTTTQRYVALYAKLLKQHTT